jgi:hypothetical protein
LATDRSERRNPHRRRRLARAPSAWLTNSDAPIGAVAAVRVGRRSALRVLCGIPRHIGHSRFGADRRVKGHAAVCSFGRFLRGWEAKPLPRFWSAWTIRTQSGWVARLALSMRRKLPSTVEALDHPHGVTVESDVQDSRVHK